MVTDKPRKPHHARRDTSDAQWKAAAQLATEYRKTHDISQKELAARLGADRSDLGRIERGMKHPTWLAHKIIEYCTPAVAEAAQDPAPATPA